MKFFTFMLMEKNGPIYEIAFKFKTLVGILSSRIINQVPLEKCKKYKKKNVQNRQGGLEQLWNGDVQINFFFNEYMPVLSFFIYCIKVTHLSASYIVGSRGASQLGGTF